MPDSPKVNERERRKLDIVAGRSTYVLYISWSLEAALALYDDVRGLAQSPSSSRKRDLCAISWCLSPKYDVTSHFFNLVHLPLAVSDVHCQDIAHAVYIWSYSALYGRWRIRELIIVARPVPRSAVLGNRASTLCDRKTPRMLTPLPFEHLFCCCCNGGA
jgi:hypothetical protein